MLPNCGFGSDTDQGALVRLACPAGSGGGANRPLVSGAFGSRTSILDPAHWAPHWSEGEPLGEARPVIRLYPGVIGAPVRKRPTPESCQLSVTQPSGRTPSSL